MNFEKAYKDLKNGKRIRRKSWEPLMHLRYEDGKVKTFQGEITNFYDDANLLVSEGWLVKEGDGKDLTFIQALEELRNKKQLTHKQWIEKKEDKFIFIDNDNIAMCKAVEFQFMPSYKCLCANDWEILK